MKGFVSLPAAALGKVGKEHPRIIIWIGRDLQMCHLRVLLQSRVPILGRGDSEQGEERMAVGSAGVWM